MPCVLAQTEAEVAAAQRLRYRVFYEEMNAKPSMESAWTRRDIADYDAVVGTYRPNFRISFTIAGRLKRIGRPHIRAAISI